MPDIKEILSKVIEEGATILTKYGLKLLVAILILIVGLFVIGRVKKLINAGFVKSKIDVSVAKFLNSAISIILKVILTMTVIQQLEIPTASFVAIIGAAGLGIGFALQGSLSNLAGGLIILLLRPFSVGDFIKDNGSGTEGTVEEIQVFYTTLLTPDNKTVVIPNGNLANSCIVNYNKEDTRRVDLNFGAAYSDDINLVKSTIQKVIDEHPLIVKRDQTVIKISEHGDSAVIYLVRAWCVSTDYLQVKYDLIELVKIAFDEAGVNIPYPHMDVNIINQ
ncbi:MAG: mechanosensitive ion channel [Vallitaleaceae bacterium]|jgi:small conductance mechanosensitive channel|nr:mechanosensitive ion channel [Vallitaleaceae bacterium]